MAYTVNMDSAFMVLRGWPADGALDHAVEINTGVTLNAGDTVTLNGSGKLVLSGAAGAGNAHAGFVVQGNGDNASVRASKKAVVLWGNFIARTQKIAAGPTYAPGMAVMVANGVITEHTGTNPVAGYVMQAHAAAGTDPASLTILVR